MLAQFAGRPVPDCTAPPCRRRARDQILEAANTQCPANGLELSGGEPNLSLPHKLNAKGILPSQLVLRDSRPPDPVVMPALAQKASQAHR